jgi:hypothetical protein
MEPREPIGNLREHVGNKGKVKKFLPPTQNSKEKRLVGGTS